MNRNRAPSLRQPVEPASGRTILQVAIRTADGVIHTMPRPARHGEIINRIWQRYNDPKVGEQGFLLSDGSFADRTEAIVIARAQGQIIPTPHRPAGASEFLFSEDCW